MSQAEAYRQLVAARAGGACEYCRLLESATGVTFHIEHVTPRSHGGETVLTNLALSCPGCNLAKAERSESRICPAASSTGRVNRMNTIKDLPEHSRPRKKVQ